MSYVMKNLYLITLWLDDIHTYLNKLKKKSTTE